ncbi:MAG: DUF4332 domain-containing protein, partial [Promethearchaeota archaeon]
MVKYELARFESIGEEYSRRFMEMLGIKYADEILQMPVEKIRENVKIESSRLEQILDVINLFQVPHISVKDAELLYYANINSVRELAHRDPVRIFYKLKEIDVKTRIILIELPTFTSIQRWVYFARLMVKRIKYGLNIPIISLPMINIDRASELKLFGIYTVEDFMTRSGSIWDLRRRLNMTKHEYMLLFGMIGLLGIDGIDVYIADV